MAKHDGEIVAAEDADAGALGGLPTFADSEAHAHEAALVRFLAGETERGCHDGAFAKQAGLTAGKGKFPPR